ncbi:preprotein translocase, SecE subunit [Isosphaera pallida ATCC 43644]|uniref:Protein translocase subunit SecE n=1 Tax=Isosphaera pallida (strain ATCC 43644 / DSM 9630 / IS1B) TaxID=575540 RepID=E8R5G7_ISOPI|nr:preprotein translocase subunit SecE [Isosphaera pallida]ADV60708.1 preprotein translocase, SecE subunit [Isosphaera pallida ATCC 43644]
MGQVKDGSQTAAKAAARAEGDFGGSAKPKRQGPTYWTNLVSTDLYKFNLGRKVRWTTFIALAILIVYGVQQLTVQLADQSLLVARVFPLGFGGLLLWIAFRTIQYPRFAEFLIATEAEMNKVSWISRDDLRTSTIVVLVCVVILSIYLFIVDIIWLKILELVGVIQR